HPVAELDEVLRQRHPPVGVLLRSLPAPGVLCLHLGRDLRAQDRCVESSSVGRSVCGCASFDADEPVTSSTVGADDVSSSWRWAVPAFPSFSPRRSSTSDLSTLSDLPMFFAIIGSFGAPKIRRITMTRMRMWMGSGRMNAPWGSMLRTSLV